MYDRVKPSEGSSRPALFYGLVKLHKPSVPLRPVVSACGTAIYNLARFLSSIIRPLVGSSGRNLKNTEDLVESMKEVTLDEDEILVSYDVKNLFTNIPVAESVEICNKRLLADVTLSERTTMDVATIIDLLRFCLTSTSFRYDNQHYKQLDGLAIGSPVSPVMADIFMENFEDNALIDETVKPRIWKRFVDDIISVVKKSQSNRLLSHLNTQHKKIQFTMEEEKDGSLPFMDIRFTRKLNGELEREVYQKPTHTNRYVHFTSHHPISVKSGVIDCLMYRATTVASSDDILRKETVRVVETMRQNGYPKCFTERVISKQRKRTGQERQGRKRNDDEPMEQANIPFVDGVSQEIKRIARSAGIQCTFFTPSTTRPLYNVKDRLPAGSRTHAVYAVTCQTCGEQYVGETLRSVEVRCKEHKDAIRLGQTAKSAIAEHVHGQINTHVIDWQHVQIIDGARRTRERKTREAFQIEKRQPRMNRDSGIEKSGTWSAII